jgi:membrane-associated protease RseP (regulator of RpoE activity)
MLAAKIFAICIATMLLHVTALAACARLAKIPIRLITLGIGWTLLKIGLLQIKLLPLGGSVHMKDSRTETLTEAELADAFDHQPRWRQAAIPLGGSLSVLGVSLLLLGIEGWDAFLSGFHQVFAGALSPLTVGPQLIAAFVSGVESDPVAWSFGLFCAKIAAVNLLPLPSLNGGDALMALLGLNKASEQTRVKLLTMSVCVVLLLWGGWLLAASVYVARQLA